jgi:hypothetical protein
MGLTVVLQRTRAGQIAFHGSLSDPHGLFAMLIHHHLTTRTDESTPRQARAGLVFYGDGSTWK